MNATTYLKPEVVNQIQRLDLKAKFIVEGFLSGLHRSPFHGFSVEFSEHRKYETGDAPHLIDWSLYARTDRYYIKKYIAETNVSCYMVLDTSNSMNYPDNGITKLDYGISIAASLGYLLLRQNDPVGLISFSDQIENYISPRSRKTQLFSILKVLSEIKPSKRTDLANAISEIANMIKKRSLIVIISDFLTDPEKFEKAIAQLAFRKHSIIVFHILDHSELTFPFQAFSTFEDLETRETITSDPETLKKNYLKAINSYAEEIKTTCLKSNIEYTLLDTATPFDKALLTFLLTRRKKC